jgi:heat shock protein HslJ
LIGTYSEDAGTIYFGPISATMMACPEPLMEQERRLLEILQGELSFELSEKGALILTGIDDRKISARR